VLIAIAAPLFCLPFFAVALRLGVRTAKTGRALIVGRPNGQRRVSSMAQS
jgi:hypothetical protein